LSRSTATRMSTSPSYSFFVACARAASTAPNTTSRSTFFSREMASTSINNSRFISSLSCCLGLSPLEVHNRCQPRFSQLVRRKTQRLQWRRDLFPARFLARLDGRFVAPDDLPAAVGRTLQRAAKFLAVGRNMAIRRRAHRRLERDVDHFTGKTLEILIRTQRPVDTRRRHFQPLVFDTFDLERELQLPRHFLAVLYVDKLLGARVPRQVDRDTQQPPGGALDLHEFVAEPGYGLFHDILQCHCLCGAPKKTTKRNQPKKTGGEYPPVWS